MSKFLTTEPSSLWRQRCKWVSKKTLSGLKWTCKTTLSGLKWTFKNLRCKRKRPNDVISASFVVNCHNGNIKLAERDLIEYPSLDVEKGLFVAVDNNQELLVRWLLARNKFSNLNSCLEVASKKGYSALCQILVSAGADKDYGIRSATNSSLIRMFYRM